MRTIVTVVVRSVCVPLSVLKRMNRSRCRLGCGLKRACARNFGGGRAHPHGKRHFGGHTWACPDLPVIDILNVIRQGASAMATSVLQQLVFNLTGLWQLQLVGHLLDLATYKQKSNA